MIFPLLWLWADARKLEPWWKLTPTGSNRAEPIIPCSPFFTPDLHPGGCGDAAAVALLLELGANVNAKDKRGGATALHYAAWHGNREIAELLLAHDAAINQSDDTYNASPVDWALENGQREMADFLVTSGT